ncbi:MAG TPA: hypothetical protein VH498_06710 [Candidatus Dormibacteraeota bacterium]|nr:hypothetical protein [Candidatus Dormibacteraeota bacterium]
MSASAIRRPAGAGVVGPVAARQRLEGGTERRPAHGIEGAVQGHDPAAAADQLQAAARDGVEVLGEEALGVAGVAGVHAVAPEAADRVALGEAEQCGLVEDDRWHGGRVGIRGSGGGSVAALAYELRTGGLLGGQ